MKFEVYKFTYGPDEDAADACERDMASPVDVFPNAGEPVTRRVATLTANSLAEAKKQFLSKYHTERVDEDHVAEYSLYSEDDSSTNLEDSEWARNKYVVEIQRGGDIFPQFFEHREDALYEYDYRTAHKASDEEVRIGRIKSQYDYNKTLSWYGIDQPYQGYLLRDKRGDKNLTIEDVSKASGIPVSRISEYENGKRTIGNMRLDTASAWANALGMTTADFFDYIE